MFNEIFEYKNTQEAFECVVNNRKDIIKFIESQMYLVEKHIIKKTHSFYNECDELCFKSKNIYNQALYNVRQFYF